MARVCELWFPKGSVENQKKSGFYMDDMLKNQLDIMIKNVVNDWDFTLIISAGGEVRVGKSEGGEVSVKVKENGKWVDRKFKTFKDKEKIITKSWDFKNNKEVESISEVIEEKEVKDFYEIELEDGTKNICTMDHKLFIKRKGKVIESKLKYLKVGDEIICQKISK